MSGQGDPEPFEDAALATWDGIVIGAGPAGALAARQLALGGRRVLLVEKKCFPRWKVCGACVNGHALAALRSAGLGALTTRLGGINLEQFQVGLRGRTVRLAMPEGVAVSRARLDAALVEAAQAAGVRFLSQTSAVVGHCQNETRTVQLTRAGRSVQVAARVVLVASGLRSTSLQEGSAVKTRVRPASRIGAGCVVAEAPGFYADRSIYMAVGRQGYVGAVRVEDRSLNVAAAFDPALVRRHGTPGSAAAHILATAGFPSIPDLENAPWQGTAGLTRRTLPVADERLFLIGDSAGYVEPFTGEGMAWAFVSAQGVAPLALRAIEHWDPKLCRQWSDLHRRLIGRRQRVCRTLALGLRQPWLVNLGFELIRRVPRSAGFVLRRLNAPPSSTTAS